jgi:Flp pilus assembly protein TadG
MTNDQSGAVAAVTAIGMVMFVGFAALALDIGHLLVVKNQLQRTADGAAQAGARGLWPNVLPIVSSSSAPNCDVARSRASYIATHANNMVDGAALDTSEVTIQVGHYSTQTRQFTAGCSTNSNAVKVVCQRNVTHILFAQWFGLHQANVSATSTSTMGPAGGIGRGALPIAINNPYVIPGRELFINFTPDPMDNGGWFADPPDKASAATFRDYIENGSCPPLRIGDLINLQNGNDASVLHDLQAQLNAHGGTWDTYLPVVNTDRFNHAEPIIAFVPFRITEVVDTANSKGVRGTVLGTAIFSNAEPGSDTNAGLLSTPRSVN